ncbi:location of vulva defective 1-like isoform X1 [Argonauta hians]
MSNLHHQTLSTDPKIPSVAASSSMSVTTTTTSCSSSSTTTTAVTATAALATTVTTTSNPFNTAGTITATTTTNTTAVTTTTNNTTISSNATPTTTTTTNTTSSVRQQQQQPSIYHVDHNFYSEEDEDEEEPLQDCWDSIERLKEMQRCYNEAGTCLVAAFTKSLRGTIYERFAHDCAAVLGAVFGGSTDGMLLSQIQELENLLSSLMSNLVNGNLPSSSKDQELHTSQSQTLAHCVVLLLKIQYDYHTHCTSLINTFLTHHQHLTLHQHPHTPNTDSTHHPHTPNTDSTHHPHPPYTGYTQHLHPPNTGFTQHPHPSNTDPTHQYPQHPPTTDLHSMLADLSLTTTVAAATTMALPFPQGINSSSSGGGSTDLASTTTTTTTTPLHFPHVNPTADNVDILIPPPPLPPLGSFITLHNQSPLMNFQEGTDSVQLPSSSAALPYPSYLPPPQPPSSSSSSLPPSSSVFPSSPLPSTSDLPFSLFAKTNPVYVPIGVTAAGQPPHYSNPVLSPVVNPTAPLASQLADSGPTWPNVKPTIRAIGKNEKGATAYTKSAAKCQSQIASEEELDSVINLLSGSVSQQPVLPTLQLSPLHHSTTTTTTSNSMFSSLVSSPDVEDPHKVFRGNTAHRRSEGSLDLSGMAAFVGGSSNNGCVGSGGGSSSSSVCGGGGGGGGGGIRSGGRNTWPHPGYHHRSSLPAGPLGSQNLLNYDRREEYSRMLQSSSSLDYHRSSSNPVGDVCHSHSQEAQSGLYSLPASGQFMSNPDWTFPDTKLNRTWPVSSISTGAGSDTMNSSWSGVQDSSDFSDDSSSGEQFFAVGLHLVNAIDSKDSSSDEEEVPYKKGLLRAPLASHSMDNLYNCKSTHTWPPKHPWARRPNYVHNSSEFEGPDNGQSGPSTVGPSVPSSGPWSAEPLQLPHNVWPSGMASQSSSSQSSSHQGFSPALHLTANRD